MVSLRFLAKCGVVVSAFVLTTCSINGSRSLGEDCLQNRECASGLSCQPRADGRYVCQPVTEGGVTLTDSSATDSSDALVDAGDQDAAD